MSRRAKASSGVGALPVPLVAFHRLANQDSAGSWDRFAHHRARVTALIADRAGGRLCVLAAGNGNDLDLEGLAPVFDEIHLVDLDDEAVGRALARQRPEVRARLIAHAPVDLSGALRRLPGWKLSDPTPAQLAGLPDRCVRNVVASLPGPFDLVVSTCFMSQLMRTCYVALGSGGLVDEIGASLAIAHVRALVELARPGGQGLLVTDVISSETYPLDELFPERGGQAILDEITTRGMAYQATSPATLGAMLEHERQQGRIDELGRAPAWLWSFSPERTYLVHAIWFRRGPVGRREGARRAADQPV